MAEPASDPAPEAPAPASTGELEVDAEVRTAQIPIEEPAIYRDH